MRSTVLILCLASVILADFVVVSETGDTLFRGEVTEFLEREKADLPEEATYIFSSSGSERTGSLSRLMRELETIMNLGYPGEDIVIGADAVGIGTSIAPGAILDIESTESGILIPRMSSAQRDLIPSPPISSLIYNLDCNNFNYYDGGAWRAFPPTIATDIGAISGSSVVCEGETSVAYDVGEYSGAIYIWSLPDGATIASGDGTRSITVDFGANSGNLSVTAEGPCGDVTESMAVSVNPLTVGGTVTAISDTISLGSPTGDIILSGYTGSILRWQRRHDGGGWTNIAYSGDIYSETPGSIGLYEYRALVRSGICDSAFSTSDDIVVVEFESDSVTFNYSGSIQTWNVPTGVTSITIEAWGAQGGSTSYGGYSYTGGQGARMRGTFTVTPGDLLQIVVGGMGASSTTYRSGGGGGSFVWVDGASLPLIIAAGGGGAGYSNASQEDGVTGTTAQNGQGDHSSYPFGTGGTSGNGGNWGTGGCGGDTQCSGGGAGWYSNGSGMDDVGGKSRPTFAGGTGTVSGGFGGGGGGSSYGSGGGGGYSGGGGNGWQSSPYVMGAGGGGGSYNGGTDQSNTAGVRAGNGLVTISW